MEVEYETKVIPVTDELTGEIQKLIKEGWRLVPGVQPVAIYPMMRQKNVHVAANSGRGMLSIDDSKIGILRDGKLIS